MNNHVSQSIVSAWRAAVTRALWVVGLCLAVAYLIMHILLQAGGPATAQSAGPADVAGPGWHDISADPVSPDVARQILFDRQAVKPTQGVRPLVVNLPTSETEATPEIQALARALENDPKFIFDYVHNHIDYVPTFGSVNGATGTLLAGRGNDWDQTSLFIALMRAAGYSATTSWAMSSTRWIAWLTG